MVLYFIVQLAGYQDTPGNGQVFNPGGNINPVPVYAFSIMNYIPGMQSDAKGDPGFLLQFGLYPDD